MDTSGFSVAAVSLPELSSLRLGVAAERIHDAVDVVEISDDLNGIVDFHVGIAGSPEVFNIRFAASTRILRHLLGVLEQRAGFRIQGGVPPISPELPRQPGILRCLTQILCVSSDSIVTLVGRRDHHGDHLP